MSMEVVWDGIKDGIMRNYRYGYTAPRLVLFIFLLVSGGWHFRTHGWEAAKPEDLWLGLVLLVALLGSVVIRFVLKRKTKE